MRKVIAKIDLENIRANAKAFKRLTGKPICAVVKANAYGHGAEETVNALQGVADCFAVSILEEALALRVAACGTDVLILTPPVSELDAVLAIRNGFILSVGGLATAKLVVQAAKACGVRARVHLKANTGMNRYGAVAQSLGKTCKFLSAQTRYVLVEGLYSHMCEYTRVGAERHYQRFMQMRRIATAYFTGLICHLSATYGALLGGKFVLDMTRVGIGLYGYLPDGACDLQKERICALSLKKAMRVYARVANARACVYDGAGYGKPIRGIRLSERLHVLRYGYADGFLRKRENGACGFEDNANNLCMDACVRFGKAKVGAFVPVLTDAAETASRTGTISYEVLCAATRRAEMVYDDENETAICRNGKGRTERGNAEIRTSRADEKTPRGQ